MSFQIDIWYIMTMMGNCFMNFMDWGKYLRYMGKKSAVFNNFINNVNIEKQKMWKQVYLFNIQNDAYGFWCGLWWNFVTLGEFTQGIHSKTCKLRTSGILFLLETVNLKYMFNLYVNFTPQYKISGETFMFTQTAWLETLCCLN